MVQGAHTATEETAATSTLEWHETGEALTGQWCKHCSLPSVTESTWALVDLDGLRVLARYRVVECDHTNHPGVARQALMLD